MSASEEGTADAAEQTEDGVKLPLVWAEADAPAVLHANQFALQYTGDAFFLAVGQLVPPVFLGTKEEQQEQLKQLSFVPIRIVGRYLLTRRQVEELATLLQRQLARIPAVAGHESEHESPNG